MTDDPQARDFPVRRSVKLHGTLLAFATAPLFVAIPLVRFTPHPAAPIVGWVLYLAGTVFGLLLAARAAGWLGSEHRRLRRLALLTVGYALVGPVVSILAILVIED